MTNIKVYSASWCPYCHAEMEWLDSLGIKYEEIDAEPLIEQGDPNLQALPVTEIGDTRIVGFDRPAILSAIKESGE